DENSVRSRIEADPVFVPFDKPVSMLTAPSCPGSARPCHVSGSLCLPAAAPTAAEPLGPGVPRRSPGTRRPEEQKVCDNTQRFPLSIYLILCQVIRGVTCAPPT